MAGHLVTKKEKESLGQLFRTFDIDNSGNLSLEEIKNVYKEHLNKELSEEELD